MILKNSFECPKYSFYHFYINSCIVVVVVGVGGFGRVCPRTCAVIISLPGKWSIANFSVWHLDFTVWALGLDKLGFKSCSITYYL